MAEREILNHLKALANPVIAEHSQRFFKTAKGEYGYGDIFLGIRVPQVRVAVKKFRDTPTSTGARLLKSKYHEIRLFALLLLVDRFNKADIDERKTIYQLYLNNTRYINNWDLVDSSAHKIVGSYLHHKDKSILYELAQSGSLWERRIAIIASLYFIQKNQFDNTLKLATLLLHDHEDLIHKAVGWMLREVGKRERRIEEAFLDRHYQLMPRTMLRYAIEKFDLEQRQEYLKGIR